MKAPVFLCIATLASLLSGGESLQPGLYATIETSLGKITARLFEDKTPETVKNFAELANGKREFKDPRTGYWVRRPFYDGLTFHRVVKGFVIQGGCPKGDGTGGPGYHFDDEIVEELKHDQKGILSMANAGKNTNGSQFFITLAPAPHLDGKHTVFGRVVSGMEVVDRIGKVPAKDDKPLKPIRILKIRTFRIQAEDKETK